MDNNNNNSSCCSSSASSSQSFSSLSSNLGDDSGARNYLPAFLANRKPARIGSIDLHFTKLPDGRCLYTYTVDWKENIKEAAAAARQESDFTEMLQHDLVDQLPATASTTTASTSRPSLLRSPSSVAAAAEKKQQKKSLQQLKQILCAAGVPTCNQPRQPQCLRKCDGPCRRQLDVHDLTVIGLCEHAACQQCLENAPRIEASFGGLGCPNVKCFLLDMASLCPDKKRRMDTIRRAYMLNSSKSSAANSPSNISSTKYTVTTTMSIETIENPKK
uniref:Uncharacterized protein n=1 Tax=Panagrolaimus sp. PS1159 TaxID=55785 RepID=A0AC35FNS0_9BILA